MAKSSPRAVATVGTRNERRPGFEVADVVRTFGDVYVRTTPTTSEQRRVMRAIGACRTAALGGHVEQCDACGHRRCAYNSCRNRHCPKCQGKETALWMAREEEMLLPVPYFHIVFTLPHALNALVRANRRDLYGLLFRTAAATLRTFAHDPRHLGAEPAVTMVLHTWGQTLTEHAHVHCVVSGGGLSLDGRCWVVPPGGRKSRRHPFLFPVKALSKVFRGKFLAALRRARRRDRLRYAGQSEPLRAEAAWQAVNAALREQDWVVYAKRPFGGPEQVLKYLSRYTHRVAIANGRILFVGDGVVRFAYRDYADHSTQKAMTLKGPEFLRRFLLHVLPKGFVRIRHYGLTANCHRGVKLERSRELLQRTQDGSTAASEQTPAAVEEWRGPATDSDAIRCPNCGGAMRIIEALAPAGAPYDTA